MSHLTGSLNRLASNFISSKVKEILPEHFTTDYPNLVEFLESYYDYMEKDDQGFSYFISSLYQARDLNTTLLDQLNHIFSEIGIGTNVADFSINPRLVAKLFADFYREKGSANSAKLFFRGFFNEEVEIVYPKRNIFVINESFLGPDSLRYLQDDKRYQIHSILIRSGIPISKWESLYKKFVHPGGWYLSGDIFVENIVDLNLGNMPIATLDSGAGVSIFENTASIATVTFTPITLIIADDGDSDLYAERVSVNRRLSSISTFTLDQIDDQYNTFIELADENSPTFDQDSDGIIRSVDFTNTLETMDQSIFDFWDSANNTYQYQDSA
tara:strand:- start:1496 stop:2476 length:981 start_codon:yes stop_codon:yes gene_type:complete